jgi:hypothetical protein
VAQSAHRHVLLGETRVVAGGLARHAGNKWPGVAGLSCEEGGCAAEAKRAGLIRNFQWKAYELPGQNANKGPE